MTRGNGFIEKDDPRSPLTLFGDNDGSLRITRKREMTKLAKHIKQKFHHVRDLYEHGAIDPVYLNTKDQISDVLTKGLGPVDHLKICRKFMLLPESVSKKDKQPSSPKELIAQVQYLKKRACAAAC